MDLHRSMDEGHQWKFLFAGRRPKKASPLSSFSSDSFFSADRREIEIARSTTATTTTTSTSRGPLNEAPTSTARPLSRQREADQRRQRRHHIDDRHRVGAAEA